MISFETRAYRLTQNRTGFTIVELIVVIAVLGILAAIVVISYNGSLDSTAKTAIRSDLQATAAALEQERTYSNEYPDAASDLNNGKGITTSEGVELTYKRRATSYCLEGASVRPGAGAFHIDSSDSGKLLDGPCLLIVSTLAGSGTAGFADGLRTTAQFAGPHGLVIAIDGTVYVADRDNHRIRMISPSGIVSTLAGSGVAGFADGFGSSAQFNNPIGIAIDKNGDLYVADETNHRIRKVTRAGLVSTIAGSVAGFIEGPSANARFRTPRGVAVTDNGTLYVSDFSNNRIRIISPSGIVSTLAGSDEGNINGTGSSARFNRPWGMSIGPNGDIFVADSGNSTIRRVTPAGQVTTYAGTVSGFADGAASSAQFSSIHDLVAAPDGSLYIADTYNFRIRKISTSGLVTTYAGTNSPGLIDGQPGNANFGETHGLGIDRFGGLYVGDYTNFVVRKIE